MSSYGSGSYYSSMRGGSYDDRRYDDRNESRSRFSDNYRDNDLGARRQSRFSPPSYSGGQRGDRRQDQRSKAVTYPLGHLGQSGSSRYDYDRDDRDVGYSRDRNRNNNRNRSGNMRGGLNINEGPGILGAKPGAQPPSLPSDLSTPLQGLGLGGLSTDSLKAQIAQQQQQLMAMVQTQSILAAVQAQTQAQVKPRPLLSTGLLPTPSMPPDRRNQNYMRKRRMDSQGGNYGKRDRRSNDNRGRNQGGYNNRRNNQWGQRQNRRESGGSQQPRTTPRSRKRSTSETREERNKEAEGSRRKDDVTKEGLVEDSDKEKGKASKKKDSDAETNKENGTGEISTVTNFLGENVEEMVKKHFNKVKSKYVCTPCKIICIKEHSFRKHLMGKRHSSTVLENAGKELDMEEWRKFHEPVVVPPEPPAPVEPEPPKKEDAVSNQDEPTAPEQSDEELDFVKYSCNTRKMAVKNGGIITISSITEASVKITGFTDEKNMCGCEFVKAVAGFNCRLCKTFIRYGKDVSSHIQSKKHQRNYELLVQDHPQYVESQLSRNRELEEILDKREGENVVLYEVLDEDVRKSRRRRKDSQGCDQTELPITKFVTEEDKGNHKVPGEEVEATEDEVIEESLLQDNDESYCDEQQTKDGELDHGDLDHEDLDHEDLDHGDLHHGDPDHGTEEEIERENLLLMEDQEDKEDMETSALSNTEVFATPEPKVESDDEVEMSVMTSPDVVDLPSGRSQSDRDSLSPEKLAPTATPGRTEAVRVEVNTESGDGDSQDEKVTPSPSRRGGKRGGRGGRAGGRGRGRGKGTRRSARNAAPRATMETKKNAAKVEEPVVDADTEDVDFMDGFEVIDEIAEED